MTFPLACPEAAAEIPLQLQRTEIMVWMFSKTLRPMFLLPISKPATSAPVPVWVSWTSRLQAAVVELTRYFSAPSDGVRRSKAARKHSSLVGVSGSSVVAALGVDACLVSFHLQDPQEMEVLESPRVRKACF